MQGVRHTNGSQTRMEPHKVLSLVSSDVDILVIHGNEVSHEEISKGISKVLGRDRTGGFQETSADPSKCDHDGVEKFEIRVCVWSDGDGVQPFPGLGSRRRS